MTTDNIKQNNNSPLPAGKPKGKHRNLRRLILSIAAIALVCWGVWQFRSMASTYEGKEATWLKIPAGSSPEEVRDQLTSVLGASYGSDVLRHWDGDTAVTRGAYMVEPGTKAISLAKALNEGRQTPVKLTFNNIRTLGQLAGRMAARLDMDSVAFIKAFNEKAAEAGITPEILIGRMVPDTYEVYWTASPSQVIDKILKNNDRFWTTERRRKAESLGLTPDQAATIASIAEEESSKADERGRIGRLYLNRYKRGMKLQADPTVKFALGDFSIRRVGGPMLETDSPYNTYRYAGLPPGPIRIPERATIDAILDAPPHDYIYMCARADFSGYHDFTSDYAVHQRNAAAFRRALDSRGISLEAPARHMPSQD